MEKRRLTLLTNWLIVLMAVILAGNRLLHLGFTQIPWAALMVSSLAIANIVYLKKGGSLDKSCFSLCLILILGLGASGATNGAFMGPTLTLSPIIPILAVLLVGPKGGWLATIAVAIILTLLFFLQLGGFIQPNPLSAAALLIAKLVSTLFTILICTWLAWVFAKHNKQLLELNRDQANTDYLTGLANRRSMEDSLYKEISRVRRNCGWLSLIIIDVDHFKKYNDCNGHKGGDECLIRLANVIANTVNRPIDIASRYGGEEFVIVLPETNGAGAQKVAENIRRKVEQLSIPYEADSEDVVTLTLGVVSAYGKEAENGNSLIKLADTALYLGKKKGRNCVQVADLEASSECAAPRSGSDEKELTASNKHFGVPLASR